MRDYLDLLGLSTSARASEIRRRSARWPRRWHPDFGAVSPPGPPDGLVPFRTDVAVDFVSMVAFVERMQQGFFGEAPRATTPGHRVT